jgi:hypothetical protein
MPGLNVKVYDCWVTGVREQDRLVDVKSRGGVTFEACSYLLPWISAVGVGIDVIPKYGDQCLVLATSPAGGGSGRMAMVIGFKIPTSPEYAGKELGGRREGLPQGSIAIRAGLEGDENALLLLTPGGTVLLSANETCRTLYSPVDSSIVTLFNNWELRGPGGFVRWTRETGTDDVAYHALYATKVALATNPEEAQSAPGELAVEVKIGGEGDDPLDVSVASAPESNPFLRVRVTADGEAFVEGESINIIGRAGVTIDGANVTIKGRQVLGQGDPI